MSKFFKKSFFDTLLIEHKIETDQENLLKEFHNKHRLLEQSNQREDEIDSINDNGVDFKCIKVEDVFNDLGWFVDHIAKVFDVDPIKYRKLIEKSDADDRSILYFNSIEFHSDNGVCQYSSQIMLVLGVSDKYILRQRSYFNDRLLNNKNECLNKEWLTTKYSEKAIIFKPGTFFHFNITVPHSVMKMAELYKNSEVRSRGEGYYNHINDEFCIVAMILPHPMYIGRDSNSVDISIRKNMAKEFNWNIESEI